MFEAAIQPVTAESGALMRPLDWGELVARFSAARDLRALVARPIGTASSFKARAGAGLPHDSRLGSHTADRREPAVNHDALEPMKPLATINTATTQDGAEGDQGTQ